MSTRPIAAAVLLSLLLAPLSSAQSVPSCRIETASRLFVATSANELKAGPGCHYTGHRLSTPSGALADSAIITISDWMTSTPHAASAMFTAVPGKPGFLKPWRLALEFKAEDVPLGFSDADMRVYADCVGMPAQQPPVFCMPEADPAIDVEARLAAVDLTELPTLTLAAPRLMTLTTPSEDLSFTRVTPLEVSGQLRDFLLRYKMPQGSFNGYLAALRVKGAVNDSSYPVPTIDALGRFTAPGVVLEENENVVTAWTIDPHHNRSFQRKTVVLDTTLPVVTWSGIAENAYLRLAGVASLRASDRYLSGVSFSATIDGTPEASLTCNDSDPDPAVHTCAIRAGKEGDYVLTGTASDHAGNVTTRTLAFAVDRTRPELSISGVNDQEIRATPFTVTPVVTDRHRDPAREHFRLERGATLVAESATPTPWDITTPGDYTLTITAIDRAGNDAFRRFTFSLDDRDPLVAITTPRDGLWLNATTIDVHGAVSDEHLASVTLTPGDIVAGLGAGAFQALGLALSEGENVVTATARDAASRAATATVMVHRDSVAPVITVSPLPALTRERRARVNATVSDLHLGEVWLGGRLLVDRAGDPSPYVVDTEVQLNHGENHIVIAALDVAGNRAETTLTTTLDSGCDSLHVLAPGDGHLTRAETIVVSGVATDASGIEVTVAALPATLDADGHFDVRVALHEGDNPIPIEGVDGGGNHCSRSLSVVRDRTQPKLVTKTPGDGQGEVPLTTPLLLTFSEPIKLNAGLTVSVVGVIQVGDKTVTFVPTGGWPADSTIDVNLTAAVTDRLGNALSNPASWSFTTIDATPPDQVVIDPPLASVTAESGIAVCGHAEPSSTVRVEGNDVAIEVAANHTGAFCATLALELNTLNQIHVRARDGHGNHGPGTIAYVRQETVKPVVTAAIVIDPSLIVVSFSKPMDTTTLDPVSVIVDDGTTELAREVTANLATAEVVVTAPGFDATSTPFVLTVTTAASDRLGHPLGFRFAKVFNAGAAMAVGEVYDAGSGLRLPGVEVRVHRVGGMPPVGRVPQATSAKDGGFALPLDATGETVLVAEREGFAPGYRAVTVTAGLVTPVFDFRLARLAASDAEVAVAGGSLSFGRVLVTLPAGLPVGTRVRVSELPEQGLAARLPAGWTPVSALDVRPYSLTLPAPATLRVPNPAELTASTRLQLVRFDDDRGEWMVEVPPSVAADAATLVATVEHLGSFAFVVADEVPVVPPAAEIGLALRGVATPVTSPVLTPTLGLTPTTILPSGGSSATVELRPADPMTSGVPLQVDVKEALELIDRNWVEIPVYVADVVSYGAGASFPVKPQAAKAFALFRQGTITLRVYEFPDNLPGGHVMGKLAASYSQGALTLTVPAAAVDGPTPLTMSERGAIDLGLAPASFRLLRAVELGFGGASLKLGAKLALDGDPSEFTGVTHAALLRQTEVMERIRWVFVAMVDASAARLESVSDVTTPGVRAGGLYAFVELTSAWARCSGTIREANAQLIDDAMVDAWSDGGPVGLSYDRGLWATLATAASTPATLDAESPHSRDRIDDLPLAVTPYEVKTEVALTLAATGPWAASDPPNGARGVATSRSITLLFNEPIELGSLQSQGAVEVTADGQPVTGTTLGVLGGMQALFDPLADLPANAVIEVAVGSAIVDRAGHGCRAETFTFSTVDTTPPVKPARAAITVWAPDADSNLCVEVIDPGPAVVAVIATNLATGFAKGLTLDHGIYKGCLWGEYGHVIRVSVLDDAANTASEDFDLFLERDAPAPTVVVAARGGRFIASDSDGSYAVAVPAGAFPVGARLTLDPRPLADLDIAPEHFTPLSAFRFDIRGAELSEADLDLAVDPGSTPIHPDEDVVFLVRVVELNGVKYPELVSQMEVGVDGKLRTRHPAITVSTDPTRQLKSKSTNAAAPEDAELGDIPSQVAGLRRRGDYAILVGTGLMFEIAYSFSFASAGVVGITVGLANFTAFTYVAIDAAHPIVLPVLAGQPFEVHYFDGSGRNLLRRRIPAIDVGRGASEIATVGEPEVYVTMAAPGRVYRFDLSRMMTTVGPFMVAEVDPAARDDNHDGIPDGADFKLELRAAPGATSAGAHVRVLDGKSGRAIAGVAKPDGSFTLELTDCNVGDPIVLALETVGVDPTTALVIELNRALHLDAIKAGASLIARDEPGKPAFAHSLRVHQRGRGYTFEPTPALLPDRGYELTLEPKQAFKAPFIGYFRTRDLAATVATRFRLDDANDMVKSGALLFVAAGDDGLRIYDTSDPSQPPDAPPLAAVATSGRARGVALFRHGSARHLVLTGGGEGAPGFVSVFDVSTDALLSQPKLVRGEVASRPLGHSNEDGRVPGVPLRVRVVEGELPSGQRDVGLVAVLGVGLQVWNLTRMAQDLEPRSPWSVIAQYPADDIHDVTPFVQVRDQLPEPSTTGKPVKVSHLRAAIAQQRGLRLLGLGDPAHPQELGSLSLNGGVTALQVFTDFASIDLRDGKQLRRDLAFVTARAAGVHVVDISEASKPRLLTTLTLDGPALEIGLDRLSQRAAIGMGTAGLAIIDISGSYLGNDTTAKPAQVVVRIRDRGNFNTGLLADTDLGTLYASAENEGVVALRLAGPRPQFVAEWDEPSQQYPILSDLVPLGVAPPIATPHTSIARVAVGLPGGSGRKAVVELTTRDAYGNEPRDPHFDGILARIEHLELVRQSDDKADPRFNLFASEPISFTADPRQLSSTLTNLRAGDSIHARLLSESELPTPRPADLADLTWLTSAEIANASAAVRSWPLDLVPTPQPAPAIGASSGSGDVLSVLLHSGEFGWAESDLSVPGRGLDFTFDRHHRSQSHHNGPFGRAWDSPYLARARVWPDRSIVFWDGAGNRFIYPRREVPAADGRQYDTPVPRTEVATATVEGVVLTAPNGASLAFNVEGDLERIRDRNGNQVRFLRDASGRLDTILDTMGRAYRIEWDSVGRIQRVRDFTGRAIVYIYNPQDELTSATLSPAGTGPSFTKSYTYETTASAKHALKTLVNEKGVPWLENVYEGGRVVGQKWNGKDLAVHYNNVHEVEVTDRRGTERLYTHNPSGQLIALAEQSATDQPVTNWAFDGFGRLAKVTKPLGNSVEYTYEVNSLSDDPRRRGNVITITRRPDAERGGEVETVGQVFSADNLLTLSRNEQGKETTYRYDAQRNLIEVNAPRSTRVSYELNRYGQPVSETRGTDGTNTTRTGFTYWPETSPGGGDPTLPADGLDAATGGYPREVTIDTAGRALANSLSYDALGRQVWRSDPAGTVHRATDLDVRGLPARTIRDAGGFGYTTNHTWDALGLPYQTSYYHNGADGNVTITEIHDEFGRKTSTAITGPGLTTPLLTSLTYTAIDTIETVTDPGGVVTTNTYDRRDQVTNVTRAAGALSVVETVEYDRNGNRQVEHTPRVESTVYERNGLDRVKKIDAPLGLTHRYTYWPGGLVRDELIERLATIENPLTVMKTLDHSYDDLGFPSFLRVGPTPNIETGTTYDRRGLLVAIDDPLGRSWDTQYDGTGAVEETTDPLGNQVSYTYHALGGVETETHRDSEGPSVTTTTRYDSLGRVHEYIDAAGHKTTSTWDSRDNLKTATDALGNVTTYAYDALDRVIAVAGPDGETVTNTYDHHGNLLTYTDANGNATNHQYDDLGRPIEVTYPGLAPATTRYLDHSDFVESKTDPVGIRSDYDYDPAGRMTECKIYGVDTFLADTETFGYDELDRPTLLKNYTAELRRDYNKSGNTVSETVKVDGHDRTLTREFDLRGDPTALTYPGGRQLAFTRDDLGRLDLIRSGATTIADYGYAGAARLLEKKVSDIAPLVSSYTYDSEWMPHGVTRAVGPNQLVNQTFGWTARHEIDRESNLLRRQVGSRFDYDAAGRLDHAGFGVPEGRNLNQGLRVLDYGHDQVRNRTSLSERVGGPYAKSIGLTEVGIGNRYAKYDGQPLSYHADGSTKTDQAGRALEYDHAGRLTRVERNGEVVTYGYDVLGRKVKRTDADGTTYFWYDGWQLIEETDATGAVLREIVNGPKVDEPLQYKVNGITYRPIQDRMGSVTAIVNEVGKLVEAFEYGPYGSFRAHRAESLEQVRLESMRLVLRFTGEVGGATISALHLTPNTPGTWTASDDGRELSFLPDDGDDANLDPDWQPLNYTIEVPNSTRTAFGIELQEGRLTSFNASDLNDRFLGDWRTPEVERVAQDPDGKLHVVFSEPIADLNLATAFLLTEAANSYPIPFTVARSASNLVAEIIPSEPLTVEADYRLELIAEKVEDLAAKRAASRSWTFTCNENPHRIWDTEQNTVSASLFGNRLFFQGRELDPVTGLYDFRNRWYDPESGRFLTPDPLGYPDGPNQYAAFLADPANNSDPSGEAVPLLALGLAAYWGLTETAANSEPTSLLGSMAPSQNAARLWGLDPDTGEQLGALDMALAGVGVAGDLAFGAGAFMQLRHGVRAASALERFARVDRALAGASVALHGANGNPVAAGFSALGLFGPGRMPCRSSFVEGTPVLTANGSVPIEQIKAGDEVIAWDEATQAPIARRVLGTSVRIAGELIVLEVAGTTIGTTAEHPFWVVGNGWTEAVHLAVGDELFSASGEAFAIGAIDFRYGRFVVRNFEVEIAHDYFVGGGLLVHNDECDKLFRRWERRNSITQATELGEYPRWFSSSASEKAETIQGRYWMNRALFADAGEFTHRQLSVMEYGFAPQARALVRNAKTGMSGVISVTKEIHHNLRNRGVPGFDEPLHLREVWPWEHAAIDQFRRTGYEFVAFIK